MNPRAASAMRAVMAEVAGEAHAWVTLEKVGISGNIQTEEEGKMVAQQPQLARLEAARATPLMRAAGGGAAAVSAEVSAAAAAAAAATPAMMAVVAGISAAARAMGVATP